MARKSRSSCWACPGSDDEFGATHGLIVARCRQSYEPEWRFHVRTATYVGPEAVYKESGSCEEAMWVNFPRWPQSQIKGIAVIPLSAMAGPPRCPDAVQMITLLTITVMGAQFARLERQ